VGSFNNVDLVFLAANFNWKFSPRELR